MNFDMKKLRRLMANLSDAKVEEKVQAASLVDASNALKAQEAVWKTSNESLNMHQKALDDFIREQTKVAEVTEPEAGA